MTLLPLILAVLISCTAVAVNARSNFYAFAQEFAATYDKHYPALQVNSDGIVTAAADHTQPFDFRLNGTPFIVDPTNKMSFDLVKGDIAMLITDGKVYQRAMVDISPKQITGVLPYCLLVPEKGQTTVIDGSHISTWLAENRTGVGLLVMTTIFVLKLLSESLWSAVMLFLLRPAIMIGAAMGAKRLIMPNRASTGLARRLLVPVVLFAGIMQATGYSAAAVMGGENAARSCGTSPAA